MTPKELKERKALELAHIKFGVLVDVFVTSSKEWELRLPRSIELPFYDVCEYRLHQPIKP